MLNRNQPQPVDGQAPARRIGALIASLVILCACICGLSLWYLFAREGLERLMTSFALLGKGITTTGTVTDVEEFSSKDPSFPTSSYRLTVSYEVNSETYSMVSSGIYRPIGRSWVGESLPIIYDPEDPSRALIDTFRERWLEPLLNSLP